MRTLEQDRARKKKEYAIDPVKHRQQKLEWRINNREKVLFYSARARAKDRNLEFDIDLEDIIIPEICPVFKIPFDTVNGTGVKKYSPSLDRIDSSKGYIKGNVRVISWRANDLIGNGTKEEMKAISEFLNGA